MGAVQKAIFFCGKHLNFGKAKQGSSKYQTRNPTFGEKVVALTSEEKVCSSIHWIMVFATWTNHLQLVGGFKDLNYFP